MLLEKQGQQAPLTQSRHKPSLCKKKNAVSVTHNKMRYACAHLRFVDGKVKAQRRDDLLRVPQLLSDRNKSRLWDSSHSSHSWRGGSSSVLMLQWSLQACEQGQCGREREVKTPSLCRGSSITRCRWCFSHQHCLSGRHPWADMKADEPFPYPEDSSPATGSESNFSWQSIPPAESYTRTSQKPSPPFPSTWCYKQTQVSSTSQYTSGFCSLFLYKHKLLKPHKTTVSFSHQVQIICMILSLLWYTIPVPRKGRTNVMCWYSHLWH